MIFKRLVLTPSVSLCVWDHSFQNNSIPVKCLFFFIFCEWFNQVVTWRAATKPWARSFQAIVLSRERSLLFVKPNQNKTKTEKKKPTSDIFHNKNINLKSKYEYLVLITRETVWELKPKQPYLYWGMSFSRKSTLFRDLRSDFWKFFFLGIFRGVFSWLWLSVAAVILPAYKWLCWTPAAGPSSSGGARRGSCQDTPIREGSRPPRRHEAPEEGPLRRGRGEGGAREEIGEVVI